MNKVIKPKNHVRNIQYGIGATVIVAILVSVVNPVNGWVFGLITIVLVTLPMTLIMFIVQNVQARRDKPTESIKPTDLPENAIPTDAPEFVLTPTSKGFRTKGRVHLGIGIFVLTFAIVNLIQVQTLPLWDRMFAAPFWWIIAASSIVSFILANTNFIKASAPKHGEDQASASTEL